MKDPQVLLKGNAVEGWSIRTSRGDYAVLLRSSFERADLLEQYGITAELEILEWAHDPMLRVSLHQMYEAVYGRSLNHPLRMEPVWLAERIRDAFRRGDLVLAPSDWQISTMGGEGTQTEAEYEEEPPLAPAEVEEKVWFRARLRDEDGIPMAGEDYVLIDSAGARREGKLDANGEVYIPPILPHGNCTISFPNIHLNPRKRH